MPVILDGHKIGVVDELPLNALLSIDLPGGLRSIARDKSGATSTENSLLGALIALAVIAAVGELGSLAFQIFDLRADTVEQVASKECGPGDGNGNCGNSGDGGGNSGGYGTGNGGGDNGQGNGSANGGGAEG